MQERHNRSKRMRSVTPWVWMPLVAMVMAALLLPAADALTGVAEPAAPVATPEPRLTPTDSERERAVSLATSDARVRAVTDSVGWSIEDVGLWTTDDPNEVLGAVVVIGLERPVTVSQRWPLYGADPDGEEAFQTVDGLVQADGVTAVRVMVDLRDDTIAKIAPLWYESGTVEAAEATPADTVSN